MVWARHLYNARACCRNEKHEEKKNKLHNFGDISILSSVFLFLSFFLFKFVKLCAASKITISSISIIRFYFMVFEWMRIVSRRNFSILLLAINRLAIKQMRVNWRSNHILIYIEFQMTFGHTTTEWNKEWFYIRFELRQMADAIEFKMCFWSNKSFEFIFIVLKIFTRDGAFDWESLLSTIWLLFESAVDSTNL